MPMRLHLGSPLAFAKGLLDSIFTRHPPSPAMATSSTAPPKLSALFNLPPEIFLLILSYLRPGDLLKFALTTYPQLQVKLNLGYLSIRTFHRLVLPPPNIALNWPLPMELTDQILGYLLDPSDVIAFCFTHRAVYLQYMGNETLDRETVAGLCSVTRLPVDGGLRALRNWTSGGR
ncbi:hypothetical protein BU16DRAFT_129965 [Lophium mytilinum]|uniref:F-box domain-containing protein n=1 Tax=Lophium mytilinum TaxID=390894 RepID=A0A6A6QKB7_9PEZI|nr:hypothetical protein BU16DRAFT_129965 [Lophium mytilinum]